MGSFVINCAVSDLPIEKGEDIVIFFIGKRINEDNHFTIYPWDKWNFMSFPIFCKMDDYGMHSLIGTKEKDESFCKTIDRTSRIAFLTITSNIFWTGKDTYNYKKNDWYEGIKDGGEHRHASYFPCDPEKVKNNSTLAYIYGKETRISLFIVRKDVYVYLLKKSPKIEETLKDFTNPFDYQVEYKRLEKIGGEEFEKFKNDELNFHRNFSFPLSSSYPFSGDLTLTMRDWIFNYTDLDSTDFSNLKNNMIDMLKLSYSMMRKCLAIRPNYSMSSQCGWSNAGDILKFKKFCHDLGDKKMLKKKKEYGY